MIRKTSKKKKTSSWKKASQEKRKKQLRLFLKWAFLFSIIFVVLNFLIEIVKNTSFDSWNGKNQISLVIVQPDNVWLVTLKPKLSEVVWVKIPNETIVNGAFGFGEVKIGSLVRLAEIGSIPPEKLVIETVRQNFGVPAVGFLRLKKVEKDLVMMFFLGLIGQDRTNKTNMTRLEILRVLWFVKSLRPDQMQSFDLKVLQSLTLQTEPDGSEVYQLQREQLDIFMNRYFSDADLVDEEIAWEVFNATDHLGLAEMIARILKNSGSMVVGVRTIDFVEESAIYKSKDIKKSNYSLKFWGKILNLSVKEGLPENAKSDVVIVLGEDFLENF